MGKYAAETQVSVERSRGEIEGTLERYGAEQFSYARDDSRGLACIQFRAHGRVIRFVLELPQRDSEEFQLTPAGRRKRDPAAAYKAWEQACRQKWRALALAIKAKLECVESGISEFEQEFLAYVVLPDGKTAGEWLRPQIEQAYLERKMPELLALPKGK